jgi:hypothetical protein
MTSVLRIQGDPTGWAVDANSPADIIRQALISQGGPVTVNVEAPLKGRLILSTRSVAGVAVLMPPAGWLPGGAIQPRATLYVPSPAGPTTQDHGYTLQASADLAALESAIITAMTDGTAIEIPVADQASLGSLVLNGRALPFVVLCPPSVR